MKENEKQYVEAPSGPSFLCKLLMARIAWALEDVHILWIRNEEFPWNCINVKMHDRKCVLLNCCVIGSVCLWIVKGLGKVGSQFESWRCWAVNWCEIDLRQGSHQIVYALSVFIGPSSFGIRAGCVVVASIELVTIKVIWDVRIMSSYSGEEIPEELLAQENRELNLVRRFDFWTI